LVLDLSTTVLGLSTTVQGLSTAGLKQIYGNVGISIFCTIFCHLS
jgi:hypothetical protein